MSMSLLSSLRRNLEVEASPTRCAAKRPRRVFASEVMTRLYGRGAAGVLDPPRDPEVESPLVSALPDVAGREGRAPFEAVVGAVAGFVARAQPPVP